MLKIFLKYLNFENILKKMYSCSGAFRDDHFCISTFTSHASKNVRKLFIFGIFATEVKFLLHIYFWINFIFFIIYMDTCEVDSKVTITNLYCNCLDLCHWKKNENFLIISRLFWMTNFVFCILRTGAFTDNQF